MSATLNSGDAPLKILAVDDHPLTREALGQVLAQVAPCVEMLEADTLAAACARLAADPEIRLVVLDPWQEQPGQWREDAPGWVRCLGTNTALAHFQQDAYGRQRVIDAD